MLVIKGSYYLNFKFERDENSALIRVHEQLRYIPKFMSAVWKLKNPKIIIPIITGVTNFKNWKNRKLEDQFKQGIIKVCCFLFCLNQFVLGFVFFSRQQIKLKFGLLRMVLMVVFLRWLVML